MGCVKKDATGDAAGAKGVELDWGAADVVGGANELETGGAGDAKEPVGDSGNGRAFCCLVARSQVA